MPRLSDQNYLQRHRLIQQAWIRVPSSFGFLKPRQQWELHTYFQTTVDLDAAELLAECRDMRAQYPTLPNRAGEAFQAYAKIVRGAGPNYEFPTVDNIYAVGVMRPVLNARQLARALIQVAQEEFKQGQEAA